MEQTTTEAAVKTGRGKRALLLLGIAVGILLGAYLALCAYATLSKTIWRDTYVLGLPVGGLTVEEATAKLEDALPQLDIVVHLYDQAQPPQPEQSFSEVAAVPVSDLGASIDTRSLAEGAWSMNATGNFLSAGWRFLTYPATFYGGDSGAVAVDADRTAQAAGETAAALSWEAADSVYHLEETALAVTLAKDGRQVDGETLKTALASGAWAAELALDIPYTVLPATALTARQIHDQVAGEMENAGYDAATKTITPERPGVAFDTAAAQALLDGALPGETVSIPADIQHPRVTAAELKTVLFRDVLGESRTHVSGTAARIANVKLSAAAINGVVLSSGQMLSYNETTGERTAAKGYQAAPAYVQGETVDEIGGGVCQTSSTLYLACLLSNLEITQRYAHRYVPAYIPWGMDATVSWGGPDYKFTNNTDYPIQVVASYHKGYLTVRILGTNTDGVTVKMTNETLSSTPAKTVYREDPTLAPGTEQVKTSPYTGYKVNTFRNLYGPDGALISSTLEAHSDYKVRDKVVLRGPALPEVPALGPVQEPEEVPAGNPTPLPLPEVPAIPPEPEEPEA